jgi:hypothetical protein
VARFLLLLSPEHRRGIRLSAAELGRRTSEFVAWVGALRRRGVIRAGARLDPDPRRVTRDRDGARVSADGGAFVGFYFVVEAPDWNAAVALAAACPGGAPGTIDVFALDGFASLRAEPEGP